MVFFNYALRKLNAKIVYYGPGLCGKTTNLQWIHDHFEGGERGKMISLATEGDRTIFFDLLPLEIGTIRGMEVTLQLYTVPGQVHYNSTRQLVLRGADGVVFVADSQRTMAQSNVESFQNLQENLRLQGIDLSSFPHVMQFNKRDLRDLLSIEELDDQLNEYRSPFFEAVATEGIGVQETLEAIVKLVMRSLRERYESMGPGAGRRPLRPQPSSEPARSEVVETPPQATQAVRVPPAEQTPPAQPEQPPMAAAPSSPVQPPPSEPEPHPAEIPDPWSDDVRTADIGPPVVEEPEPPAEPDTFDGDGEHPDGVTTAVFDEPLVRDDLQDSIARVEAATVGEVDELEELDELDELDEPDEIQELEEIEDEDEFEEHVAEAGDAWAGDAAQWEDHIRAPGPFAEIPLQPERETAGEAETPEPEPVAPPAETPFVARPGGGADDLDALVGGAREEEPPGRWDEGATLVESGGVELPPGWDEDSTMVTEPEAADAPAPEGPPQPFAQREVVGSSEPGEEEPPDQHESLELPAESGAGEGKDEAPDEVFGAPEAWPPPAGEEEAAEAGEEAIQWDPALATPSPREDRHVEGPPSGEELELEEEAVFEPAEPAPPPQAAVEPPPPEQVATERASRRRQPFVVHESDPFGDDVPADEPRQEPPPVSAEVIEPASQQIRPTVNALVNPDDNQLHLRLQGTGAIAESGQVRALDIEVPVPGSWVGNRRVTLQLRLTLSPAPEDEHDEEG